VLIHLCPSVRVSAVLSETIRTRKWRFRTY